MNVNPMNLFANNNVEPFKKHLAGVSHIMHRITITILLSLMIIPFRSKRFSSSTNGCKYAVKSSGFFGPHQMATINGSICGASMKIDAINL